jgi:4'-phosphopantetheinyl transferase
VDAPALHIVRGSAARLAQEVEQASAAFLSEAEHLRLQEIRAPARRQQFVAARWLARKLLAQVHGGAPHDWSLDAGVDGPPQVVGAKGAAAHLALSHSHDVVACAVAAVPLGIDVEAPQRSRDVMALAQVACDETERALLHARPPSEREPFFYELWTAKEAWIKRWAQSMTPHRLARIHLRPAAAFENASTRVWSGEGWTLAVAAPPGLAVHWHASAPAVRSVWDVKDDDAESEAIRPPA